MFLLSDSVTRANIFSPRKSPRRLIRFMICTGVHWSASVIRAHSNVVQDPALLSHTGSIFPARNAITQQEIWGYQSESNICIDFATEGQFWKYLLSVYETAEARKWFNNAITNRSGVKLFYMIFWDTIWQANHSFSHFALNYGSFETSWNFVKICREICMKTCFQFQSRPISPPTHTHTHTNRSNT